MKVIQTFYKGYKFRSRLEARWAVYFDAVGWKWVYEPEGFEFANGMRYLPDFAIVADATAEGYDVGAIMAYVEVKGVPPDEKEKTKAVKLAEGSGVPICFAVGLPDANALSYGLPGAGIGLGADCEGSGKLPLEDGLFSLDAYCYRKWGRPGWLMYSEDSDNDTVAACNKARAARFEFGGR